MSFTIDTKELQALGAKFSRAQPIIRDENVKAMTKSVLQVEADAKKFVPVKTGHLRRSITHEISGGGGVVTGMVGTNVPYAKAIEEGRGYLVIRAKAGKFLVFEIGGETIFTPMVVQPARPARPYLKKALVSNRAKIFHEFELIGPRVAKRLGLA